MMFLPTKAVCGSLDQLQAAQCHAMFAVQSVSSKWDHWSAMGLTGGGCDRFQCFQYSLLSLSTQTPLGSTCIIASKNISVRHPHAFFFFLSMNLFLSLWKYLSDSFSEFCIYMYSVFKPWYDPCDWLGNKNQLSLSLFLVFWYKNCLHT